MASEQTVELPRPELSAAKRALIEARLRGQVRSSGIIPRAHRESAPLSFAQERLWFIDRLEPGSAAYNISLARRLGGALDEAALERALGEIVRRHEALRTTFREVDGAPVQVIAPFAGFTLPVDDLSGLDDAAREAEVSRRAGEDAVRPFDLTAGPLFRAALLRLGAEEHVVLLSMHHIVSDGWSMGMFFRELSALYGAYREGQESPLPALPVQYADYAVWQREQLEGAMLERQLSYWRERLAGAPELLELPTDHPRLAVQSYRGAAVPMELSLELLERLQALGRGEDATLFMTLLGAFQVLLSKYSGSEDIVVGTPIAGRTRKEVAGLIGFFINTLVLRTDLSGDPSFREVLRRAREVTLGAYEHQEVPFERLVAELSPERSLSHSPVFQVMFTLQNAGGGGGALPGLEVSGVGAAMEIAKFALSLTLAATDQGLRGALKYSTDLFEPGTIERMVRHLERVLEQVAADADVRLSRMDLLGDAERALVLEAWNHTTAEYPADRCIHELFRAHAERTPEAVALVCEDRSLTYRELNARANRLAHHLRGLGVGPDAVVAMHFGRGVDAIVALLGVLKAGGAYLALDPALPPERLAYMLEDSAAVVHLDGEALRDESGADLRGGAGPGDLAYVIYTSGSTGRPKGVAVEHRQLSSYLFGLRDRLELAEGASYASVSTLSADLGNTAVFSALAWGGTLHVISEDRIFSGDLLGEYFARHGVDCLKITPSHLAALQTGGDPRRVMPRRWLVLGGESSPVRWVDELVAMAPECAVFNHYGPTEATVGALAHRVDAGRAETASGTLVLGRPLPNYQVFVVDRSLRPVPAGVAGELLIGGAGVARGYLGRPGLTAERFVASPFGQGRLYRTGDLCRWLADGTVEFLGRMDQQVKIRGFRVELGEIEAALRQDPGVAECAVVAREDAPGDRRLVAYLVGGADADSLRAGLRRTLPEYMVPAVFVFLDALPLTPNGKLDRKALPAPEHAADTDRYTAPRTPVEEVLAGIWAEVLRLERVGVHDNFFELGGHSLMATRVVSRVRELFGVEMPLRALFEGSTVAEMAARVEEMRRAELPVLPPVVPVERTGALPLSFAQERLWFIDRLDPGSAVYNMPVSWRLGGALDEAALERALGEIVRRHEALRTTFREVDGSPVQVIAPFAGFTLPVDDLSGLADAAREVEVRRRAGEEAVRPFDLTAGPLFRAALLRLGREDHVLLLSMHHIVSDGWSMGVLFRELSALYEAYGEGGESPLPELAVQYADYAVWQREQLEGEVLDRQLGYWRERLAGAPELLELPTDHPRQAVQTYRGATVPVELSLELLERLQALGRSEGTTLYMTLLGAFQVLLSKYSGSEDIVVGSPIAGRGRGEVEELIGFFINTLVLRTGLGGDPTLREVLGRVREVTLGAYENQEVPFERLVAELQPERSLSHLPVFQVLFALQNTEGRGGALPGLQVSGVGAELTSAKFDLSLALTATAQGLRGGLIYSTDLFERGTVERMVRHLERVLEQVAADADVRLSRLDLLGEAERTRLLALGEGAAPGLPRATVDALFAQAAAAAPESVALAWDGGRMTYAELDGRANRLARHLRRAGVAAGTRVGVCLERGPEMVVATLAALKSGGAYVPLDPAYPAERLAFMLADTAVPVLVTESMLADRLPPHAAHIVRVDADAAAIAAESSDAPAEGTDPEAAAYVMYTSGSTGRPKGVEVPHRAIVRLVRGQDYVSIDPSDVFLQLAPASFDAATLELWGPLLNGARLAIHPAGQPSVESIGRALAEHGVTVLWLTAGLFHLVVEERIQILRGVRQLLAGGDVLSVPHVRRVLAELPETALINGYGPTENTTFTCCHRVAEAPPAGASVPVGRPIANTYVRVLDAGMQPVPVGVPGELYAGGAGLALGYLNRPELTAEKFVADPFAPGARLYRTGDRVRWKESAEVRECVSAGVDPAPANSRTDALTHSRTAVLEFLGRVDTQVKIRGFRVEPGEVEAVLRAWPGVREAAVVVREDTPGDRRLVAYVAGEVAADEVREHLRGRLPEHMVPAAFVRLDALPLTANGKLDRKALPAPEFESAEDRYVAPRTPVEEVLAGIWAEVLRLERVGVEETFFELGGHSLLATRVVSRIREVFSVELPLRALFEGPTVAELAGRVEEMRRAELPVLPAVVPVERTRPLPLSFAQERLWFIDRLDPGSAVYNIPGAWRLAGALDVDALERALGEIVRRHEALRTAFAEVDGSPVQVIAPFTGFTLPVEDLSGLGEADREAALRQRAGEDARRAFDLAAGPLFRAALLRVGEEDHVLLISMHHVVSDGWSMGVFFRELSALYAAYREGRESPLTELAVQYADYAVWQREQLEGAVLDRQLSYWRERLAGAPELLELPTDHPRPPVQSYRGAAVPVEISHELLERLQALGRSEGATLYMTLLGAFQVLLSKYSGSEDVVVGSPIAGRGRREVEELIGFFVNTLVLRTGLGGDPTLREVLGRVREVTLGAYENQEVPFERLVAELQPERSLSHSPVFQVLFALQNTEGRGSALPGLSVSGVGAELANAKFDLSLNLTATAQGLRGGLSYSTDVFERGTVERMVRHLVRVLEQVAGDANVRLSQLELLTAEEREQVLGEWNQTERGYSALPVHELFAAWARRAPEAVALLDGREAVTYGALDRRASVLARQLRSLGVGPETPVGLCMERTPELLVGVLGIWKAGSAYVPLDPSYPTERLGWIITDAALPVVVATGSTAAVLPEHGATLVRVDQLPETAADAAAEMVTELPASDAGLAYVIYTSGSTGRPKGVLVQHGSLANLLATTREAFGVGEGDVMPALASYAFDIWLFEALLPLTSGAAVRLVDRDRVLDVPALLEEIADATLLHAVPALMRQVVQAERETPRLARLRRAFVGGDRVPADLLAEMREALRKVESHVLYGPTEGTILASAHPIPQDGIVAGHPIGRPLGNVRLYVCDALGSPQPVGIPGELLIGGAGGARGYLGRPELTAERFVPDPFGGESGARLYRTGDRARWRADGTLEFLGRLDGQVKVRGFRIEPGEIEAVLRRHESVAECVVVSRENAPGETRLVAYVVGAVEAEELRGHVRESLPEYMVPAAFVVLEQLPLTPNGKLDRKALPAPEHAADTDRYVAPRTPVEEVLAGIWAEVLRLERVGVEESFFELGGHSLLATRVVSRVRELLGVELPLRALFEGPTVVELAARVEEVRRAELPVLPPVVPVERTGTLPLSFAQERLWFIDRLDPGSAVYNMPVAWRLGGALDEAALERALGEIVRRHEALRTTFAEVDRSPVQVIAPFAGFALPVEDLSGLSEADREAAVRRRAGEEARRAFDLSAGPLFRAALLRLGDEDHVLLLSMHHIVSDGWSMGVLFRELSSLYAAYRDGGESPLRELAVQYADYAVWQREQLAGEVLDRQLAYWREQLAGVPELLELPTDRPRPPVQTYRGATAPVELSPELMERLQALGRSEGATLFMTLLGAFQVLLSKYSGSEDIVVGSPIAGRGRSEVEELIGFFVNTLVLRTDLSGDPSFREVLRRAREVTLGAYEHQEVPFERLVAELSPARSLSHSPVFQVMFTLQNAEGGGGALPGLSVSGVGAELASAKFDLSLNLSATAQGVRGGVTYSTDLFERSTIERMLGHFSRLLEQAAADADVRLSELGLLEREEREQVLGSWNHTKRGYSALPVHALFAEWARRAPEAVALLNGREAVTYGALDRRASLLARHLRDLGVGPETPVGLCMERTPELLVGVLGIWKAGGAYVPLDPGYPAERLGWIITDAALPVVVATGSTAGVLPEHGATLVQVDQLPDTALEAAPEVPASETSLAYVIYTSGSTGRPKGVLVQHGSLANLLAATREAFGVVERDVMPALASYAFDIWLFEALLPLTSGAAVRLVERERVLDVAALLEEIADATLLHAVPALMRQVVQAERETPRLARLRRAFVGGDRVPADLLAEMRETFSGAETHVLYGPTEGTILASTHPVPEDGVVAGHPIGAPLGNVRLYVCDRLGSPQPVGIPGELLIGGAGVARGYLGRPELTAERFVPDPFGAESGERLYRTGDRARWRADGTLEYLGRLDGQVKVRGFRIEPGEVEAVLRQHESVAECVVVARQSAPGETRLVAYVVGSVEAEELRQHLRKSVPEYMVPAAFVMLEQLPLTPNGKLDRRALPAPEYASAEERYVAPRTPVEELLAGIWAEVLRRERVGVHDSFFDLGGHSLLIMRLLAEIQATFDLELSIRTVYSMPTLEAMAGEIERRIYEDVATMSESEAEQLAESTSVAGA
jgi:amino acid adenylation domain-containing protein